MQKQLIENFLESNYILYCFWMIFAETAANECFVEIFLDNEITPSTSLCSYDVEVTSSCYISISIKQTKSLANQTPTYARIAFKLSAISNLKTINILLLTISTGINFFFKWTLIKKKNQPNKYLKCFETNDICWMNNVYTWKLRFLMTELSMNLEVLVSLVCPSDNCIMDFNISRGFDICCNLFAIHWIGIHKNIFNSEFIRITSETYKVGNVE